VPSKNNGTGFPDYSITGALLNLNDVHVGDTIGFVALMSGLNDGPDSFFIEAAPAVAQTPLPASAFLFGIGLVGLAGLVRKNSTRKLA
jgi:hypothetical protein